MILLSLLKACGLLRFVFTRDERKFADKKVDELVQGEVFGEAVAKLLEGNKQQFAEPECFDRGESPVLIQAGLGVDLGRI